MKQVLTRIEGETDASWEAFQFYALGGVGYSLARVAADHFPSASGKVRTLEKWSSDFDWVRRRNEFQAEIDRARNQRLEDVRKECEDLIADSLLDITSAAILMAKKSADPRLVKMLFDSVGIGKKTEGASVKFEFNASNLSDDALMQLLDKMGQ